MPNFDKTLKYAKKIKENVESKYVLGASKNWSYYFAKQVVSPRTSVKQVNIKDCAKPSGSYVSRQVYKSTYTELAKNLISYVDKNGQLPNYLQYTTKSNKTIKIAPRLYTYMFAKIVVYYANNNRLPSYVSITSKSFTEPQEYCDEIFEYFEKVFGSISCIDDAMEKIQGRGYGYYYDDRYSNLESINRMKNGNGVNCTDSAQVFYNLVLHFIKLGKYKKVECVHVKCRGGDGHVRLRITLLDGGKILRDPSCCLDGNSITTNWCADGTVIAIDPYWFMANLNR